jgi:hypothetical protein
MATLAEDQARYFCLQAQIADPTWTLPGQIISLLDAQGPAAFPQIKTLCLNDLAGNPSPIRRRVATWVAANASGTVL